MPLGLHGGQPGGAVPVPADPPSPRGVMETADITGRDFAGLRLTPTVSTGPISFTANSATVWAEGPPEAAVNRLLLSGDVRVRLGLYDFAAARAVVWVQPLGTIEPGAGADTYQIFVFFDRVGTPTADAAIAISADRLPVEGVLRTEGPITLRADRTVQGRPEDPLVREGERALAGQLRALVRGGEGVAEGAGGGGARAPRGADGGLAPGISRPFEPEAPVNDPSEVARVARNLPPADRSAPIFAATGVISFSPGSEGFSIVRGEQENAAISQGGVVVQYWDRASGQNLQLSAERVVAFLPPGTIEETLERLSRAGAEDVRGIYLEGDVMATDGQYTLRSPRVYYDLVHDRALLIDAVFWTYDAKRGLPLYVRAETIRQESKNQWVAGSARITNTAFFKPHLSIGATSVTISQKEGPAGDGGVGGDGEGTETRTVLDAKNITLRAGPVPFFYWPRYVGDPTSVPLRDIRIENRSGSGSALKTTWDAFGLLGREAPEGVGADLLLDYYFERGPALGTEMNWNSREWKGNLFVYALPSDEGTDVLKTGAEREREGEFRGLILGEHRWALSETWTLFLEASYISDETFVDAFFEQMGETRREFTNSAYARRLKGNTALTAQVKGSFNDFIANEYLLQSQGYSVDKLPELSYFRVADDVLSGLEDGAGRLSYFSEHRLTRARLNFNEPTAAEQGFEQAFQSEDLFGIAPDGSIAEALRARGFTQEPVDRFDTRHELSSKLDAGPLHITPFVVGRVTAYDDDFDEFSPDSEPTRLWGSAGTTFATSIQRVNDTVDSRFFDLHRTRHIIEPNATVWHAGTTVDRVDLPVYDDEVESLAEGTNTKFGIDQTWQTQRGGPGRWRSVDVFRLSTDYVVSSDDADRESPIGRFIEYRPEYSNPGEFAVVDGAWQVSDAVALGANTVYDVRLDQSSRTTTGVTVEHTPVFTTYAELRFLNAQDATFYNAGARYQLGRKYTLSGNLVYDANQSGFQSISTEVRRRFPNALLGFGLTYNNITSETSIGFVFQPVVRQFQASRLRGVSAAGGGETRLFGD